MKKRQPSKTRSVIAHCVADPVIVERNIHVDAHAEARVGAVSSAKRSHPSLCEDTAPVSTHERTTTVALKPRVHVKHTQNIY